MQSHYNIRTPLSCRNITTVYQSSHQHPHFFRGSPRPNRNCMTEVAQQFLNALKEQEQVAQNKHFLGFMVRKNAWPRSCTKSRTQPKAKLHNLSEYLVNCVRHRQTIGNRFKPQSQTQNIGDIMKKDKRLLQIRADIEELHRQISEDNQEPSNSFTTPISSNIEVMRQEEPSRALRHQTESALPPILEKHMLLSPITSPKLYRHSNLQSSEQQLNSATFKAKNYSRQYFIKKRKEKTRSNRALQVGPWQISD